jgi:hypothetical protein
MSQLKQEYSDENDVEDIRSIGGSERTLEETRIDIGTIGDGNGDNSINTLLQVP